MNVWAFQTMLDSVVNLLLYYIATWRIYNPDLIHNPDCFFNDDVIEAATAGLAFHAENIPFAIEPLSYRRPLAVMITDHLVFMETRPLGQRDAAIADEEFSDIYETCGRGEVGHGIYNPP